MPIKVTITSTDVRNQSGTSKTSGKPYNLSFQTMWVHLSDKAGNANPYPEKVETILEKNEAGAALFYPIGEYVLADSSVYIDRQGNWALRPVLVSPKIRTPA